MTGRAHRLSLPVIAVRAEHFWRYLPKQYVRMVLEPGPSFTHNRHYSVRGEFAVLYFSASKELSLREVASRGGDDIEAMSCVEFEVSVDRLVDLTRPETRTALSVQLEDLVRPRITRDAYSTPRDVARRVYGRG